jgi:hypothetical protein
MTLLPRVVALTSLGSVLVAAGACSSAPPTEPPMATMSQQVVCESVGCGHSGSGGGDVGSPPPPPPPPPDCNSVPATISAPASSTSWKDAVANYPGGPAAGDQWAAAMSAFGCTNPEAILVFVGGKIGGVSVTTCPEGLRGWVAPPPNYDWGSMTLTCNSVVPPAKIGSVNIAWNFGCPTALKGGICQPGEGCKMANCAGVAE